MTTDPQVRSKTTVSLVPLLDVYSPHGLGAVPPLPQSLMQILEIPQIPLILLRGKTIDSWARVLP